MKRLKSRAIVSEETHHSSVSQVKVSRGKKQTESPLQIRTRKKPYNVRDCELILISSIFQVQRGIGGNL